VLPAFLTKEHAIAEETSIRHEYVVVENESDEIAEGLDSDYFARTNREYSISRMTPKHYRCAMLFPFDPFRPAKNR
jgi:hypothetical protein